MTSGKIGRISRMGTARAAEFVELHDQVQTSVTLLDSLESFLSTFQKDLTAVAGQISDLQERSKVIDNKLRVRRKIEKPLSGLLSEIIIPPELTTLILDTDVGEPWITGIADLERKLVVLRARPRVRAARDLSEVAEGLRIVAATKLRAFFLALFHPIRSSVTTNMQIIQTSVLLKYRSVFDFLKRQALAVAQELQRSYISAARVYYETGFRRYTRSLGWIKARTTDKFENITAGDGVPEPARLDYAEIEGPGVILAYMADDKEHKEPLEAIFRSLMLVFMDNATAEYTFVSQFFARAPEGALGLPSAALPSSTELLSSHANSGEFSEPASVAGSESGGDKGPAAPTTLLACSLSKEDQSAVDGIWKQVFDPVLEYCQTFVRGVLDPMPSTIGLLTMIRLTECVGTEVQMRQCPPVETFLYSVRLELWPMFQKGMNEHVEALKKLAEGGGGSYFARASVPTESVVLMTCRRYLAYLIAFVSLTKHEEETMIFANLLRLRQELTKLIARYTSQAGDSGKSAHAQRRVCEVLLSGLRSFGGGHVKVQQEVAFWRHQDEEAQRRLRR